MAEHTLDNITPEQIAAGLLLVPCDPQPPSGARFADNHRDGLVLREFKGVGFGVATAGIPGLFIPCPYRVGDVLVFRWLAHVELAGITRDGIEMDEREDWESVRRVVTEISGPVDLRRWTPGIDGDITPLLRGIYLDEHPNERWAWAVKHEAEEATG